MQKNTFTHKALFMNTLKIFARKKRILFRERDNNMKLKGLH
jgi:hypothetical protein